MLLKTDLMSLVSGYEPKLPQHLLLIERYRFLRQPFFFWRSGFECGRTKWTPLVWRPASTHGTDATQLTIIAHQVTADVKNACSSCMLIQPFLKRTKFCVLLCRLNVCKLFWKRKMCFPIVYRFDNNYFSAYMRRHFFWLVVWNGPYFGQTISPIIRTNKPDKECDDTSTSKLKLTKAYVLPAAYAKPRLPSGITW